MSVCIYILMYREYSVTLSLLVCVSRATCNWTGCAMTRQSYTGVLCWRKLTCLSWRLCWLVWCSVFFVPIHVSSSCKQLSMSLEFILQFLNYTTTYNTQLQHRNISDMLSFCEIPPDDFPCIVICPDKTSVNVHHLTEPIFHYFSIFFLKFQIFQINSPFFANLSDIQPWIWVLLLHTCTILCGSSYSSPIIVLFIFPNISLNWYDPYTGYKKILVYQLRYSSFPLDHSTP